MLTDAVENWMRQNCIDGQVPMVVRDLLAAAKARSVGFSFVLGQRRTTDSRAYLVQGFNGEFFCFNLTPGQVANLELEEDAIAGALGLSPQRWTALENPLISLDRVVLTPASPLQNARPVTGTASYHLLRQPPHDEPMFPDVSALMGRMHPSQKAPISIIPKFPGMPSPPRMQPFFGPSPGNYPMYPGMPLPTAEALTAFEQQPTYALSLCYAFPNGPNHIKWHYLLGLSSQGSVQFSFNQFATEHPGTGAYRGPLVLFFRMVYERNPQNARGGAAVSHTLAELVDLTGESPPQPAAGRVSL